MDTDIATAEIQALLASLKSSLLGESDLADVVAPAPIDIDGPSPAKLSRDCLPDCRALRRFQLMV